MAGLKAARDAKTGEALPVAGGSLTLTLEPFRYRLVGGPPLVFDKQGDKAAYTQLLNDRLGEAIRQYPEQYLWAHRRWR